MNCIGLQISAGVARACDAECYSPPLRQAIFDDARETHNDQAIQSNEVRCMLLRHGYQVGAGRGIHESKVENMRCIIDIGFGYRSGSQASRSARASSSHEAWSCSNMRSPWHMLCRAARRLSCPRPPCCPRWHDRVSPA